MSSLANGNNKRAASWVVLFIELVKTCEPHTAIARKCCYGLDPKCSPKSAVLMGHGRSFRKWGLVEGNEGLMAEWGMGGGGGGQTRVLEGDGGILAPSCLFFFPLSASWPP